MRYHKKLLLLACFLLGSIKYLSAQEAATKKTPVRLLIKGGLEIGGDNVADIYFTNGETQKMKAGQGGSIAVGIEGQIPSIEKLLLQATVGYKYLTTAADNVHIRLTRVPVLLTANWMVTEKLRIGAGLASHYAIRFKTDGIGDDMRFKNARGPFFEIAYSGIGLTYTAMRYTDGQNNQYSANALGVSFTLTLPKK